MSLIHAEQTNISGSGGSFPSGALGSYLLTSSYIVDSASFNTRINSVTGSSYDPTNLNAFTSSISGQITNVFASESNYTPTSSFNSYSSSLQPVLAAIVSSQSLYLSTGSYLVDSSSFNLRINTNSSSLNNVFLSESKYALSSSFNTFTASYITDSGSFNTRINSVSSSFGLFSSSYVIDSASLLIKITAATYNPAVLNAFSASILTFTGSINTQIANVFASESNYTTTSSHNTFTASYLTDSASFNTRIANITGSGGTINTGSFVTTSSFQTFTGSYFTDSASFYTRISGSVSSSRQIITVLPLSGGSNLSSDITLAWNFATPNTWSSGQTFRFDAPKDIIPSSSIIFVNNVAATASTTNMYGSPVIWSTNNWKTTATANSQSVLIQMFGYSSVGAATASAGWAIQSNINNLGYITLMAVTNNLGIITVGTGGTDAIFASPGTLKLNNSGGTHFLANGNRTSMGNTFVEVANKFSVARNGTIFDPSAAIHIGAGAAAVSSAPLKFNAGPLLTITETGAVEYDGAHFYATVSGSGPRSQLDDRSGQTLLTAGTKTIAIFGITTSSLGFVGLVSGSNNYLTQFYQAVCTSGSLTLQANLISGSINTADISLVNYLVKN